jgi:GT2 family glycosyltransferase
VSTPLRGVGARLRRRSRRAGGYREFVDRVEPRLIAAPRVHTFAAPPLVGEASAAAVGLAVCVAGAGTDALAATHASLRAQTVPPAAVLEGTPTEALQATRAPHVALVQAGDRLAPTALERLGQALMLAPGRAVVTCDDDHMDGAGTRRGPRCAPGPSPDALLAGVQVGPPVVVEREAALAAGAAPGPGWELELMLALAGPDAAGHAHVPQILLHRPQRPPVDEEMLARVVERVLHARGEVGAGVHPLGAGRRRVRRPVIGEPAVEAIVCFRDRPGLLERCVRSVLERSTYPRLALRLVDNHSSQPAVLTLADNLARDPRVTLVRDDAPFNFAALNNRAAAGSQADYLVFLNNDTEVLSPDWVQDLLEEAQREEVGAVAPLLTYPNGRVQHAGAALGLHGFAGHPFAGLAPERRTPFGAAADGTRNWLAVTAACLMVGRAKFETAGGFDDSFTVGGNDVDLCLRLTAAGHRSLCVPHVRLAHDESASRDPRDLPPGDFERSREAYGQFRTVGDPFYNPNLTLSDTRCGLRRDDEVPA